MKARDYFARAQSDAEFRRQELEDKRYLRKVSRVYFTGAGSLWLLYAGYCALWEKRWVGLDGFFTSIVVMSMVYTELGTRIGALEALESEAANLMTKPG